VLLLDWDVAWSVAPGAGAPPAVRLNATIVIDALTEALAEVGVVPPAVAPAAPAPGVSSACVTASIRPLTRNFPVPSTLTRLCMR
jgi:hypothetical protein